MTTNRSISDVTSAVVKVERYLESFIGTAVLAKYRLMKTGFDPDKMALFIPASRDIEIDEALDGALILQLPVYVYLGVEPYIGVRE